VRKISKRLDLKTFLVFEEKEWLEEHEGQSRCRIIDFTAWETKNIYDDTLFQLVTDIQERQEKLLETS
jgi:hypothetical protein